MTHKPPTCYCQERKQYAELPQQSSHGHLHYPLRMGPVWILSCVIIHCKGENGLYPTVWKLLYHSLPYDAICDALECINSAHEIFKHASTDRASLRYSVVSKGIALHGYLYALAGIRVYSYSVLSVALRQMVLHNHSSSVVIVMPVLYQFAVCSKHK